MFLLSILSRRRLDKAHPHLQKLVRRAIQITSVDFKVAETLRSPKRQKELVRSGASHTLNSRHLPHPVDGLSRAVDLVALEQKRISWHWPHYHRIACAMNQAAEELGIPLEWGGEWKHFPDGPHFQLPWKDYP